MSKTNTLSIAAALATNIITPSGPLNAGLSEPMASAASAGWTVASSTSAVTTTPGALGWGVQALFTATTASTGQLRRTVDSTLVASSLKFAASNLFSLFVAPGTSSTFKIGMRNQTDASTEHSAAFSWVGGVPVAGAIVGGGSSGVVLDARGNPRLYDNGMYRVWYKVSVGDAGASDIDALDLMRLEVTGLSANGTTLYVWGASLRSDVAAVSPYLTGLGATGTDEVFRVVYPGRHRDEKGVWNFSIDGASRDGTIAIQSRLSPDAPWCTLVSYTELNSNAAGKSYPLATGLYPEMRAIFTEVGHASTTFSSWLSE